MICAVTPERDAVDLVGWGLDFGDEAVAYLPDPGEDRHASAFIRSQSAERIVGRRAFKADMRLVWIDPRPAGDSPGG